MILENSSAAAASRLWVQMEDSFMIKNARQMESRRSQALRTDGISWQLSKTSISYFRWGRDEVHYLVFSLSRTRVRIRTFDMRIWIFSQKQGRVIFMARLLLHEAKEG